MSGVKHFLMTSSKWKRQKLSESLQLKYGLISITCENHQISQHTLYIIYTYVIHLSFLPLKRRLSVISKFNINEPRREKTGLRGFKPGLTQTDM